MGGMGDGLTSAEREQEASDFKSIFGFEPLESSTTNRWVKSIEEKIVKAQLLILSDKVYSYRDEFEAFAKRFEEGISTEQIAEALTFHDELSKKAKNFRYAINEYITAADLAIAREFAAHVDCDVKRSIASMLSGGQAT